MQSPLTDPDTDADSKPSDLPQRSEGSGLLDLLISVSKATRTLIRLKLAELGFDTCQEEVLLAIDAFRPSTIGDLANRLDLRASTASAAAEQLQKRGLVACNGGCEDSRRTTILLTPAGAEARMKLESMRQQVENDLSQSLSPVQLAQMLAQLVIVERRLLDQFAR